MNTVNRIGLMVGRFQPLHNGHTKTISLMIQDCETAIVCLGSAQKSREEHDPWTVEERMQMLKNVYGDRIKIVPLNDLGATRPEQWTSYIFEKLKKLGMEGPTDYYTGSEADARWYTHKFYLDDVSYWDDSDPYSSAMNEFNRRYYSEGVLKILHLIDRDTNPVPPATDIRTYLSLRTDEWQQWVPRVNHDLVSSNYPEEFKIPKA